MILVISRIRVSTGRAADVEAALAARPHLVDGAPGLLGVEVYRDAADDASFQLVTRWSDRPSFEAWRASEAHHPSRGGIPEGLSLDAACTRVEVLERVGEPARAGRTAAPAAPLLESYLEGSAAVHVLACDLSGTIRDCNPAASKLLGRERAALVGEPLWPHLTEACGERLRRALLARPAPRERLLLSFVDGELPATLRCALDVRPEGFVLLGERHPDVSEERLTPELIRVNNELAVLARENARQARILAESREELQRALRDLEGSHWHLRKIQEVLPICIGCGRVKTAGAQWEDVVGYLKANALFLSHGYCPPCGKAAFDEVEAHERRADAERKGPE